MKGQLVGNEGPILWPNDVAMLHILSLARPRSQILTTETETTELLWPAKLINQQARLAQRKDHSRPIAISAFIISIILAIIIAPVQLILIAAMLDYNWVTSTYFPHALHYIFFFSCLVAIADFVALILAWKSQPHRTYQTITLVLGNLTLLTTIWLAGNIISLQPHQLTLVLIGVTLIFIMAYLLISKQYFTSQNNTTFTKIILSIVMLFTIIVAGLNLTSIAKSRADSDPERLTTMTIEMQQAKLRDVPLVLSDLTYLLCGGKYKLIFLAENQANGLFECSESGDVYSVQDSGQRNISTIRGNATYLGTTRDKEISLNFPTSHYLFRSLPNLTENELAIMYPAASEIELIDNITPQLLNYWNSHNDRTLFVNIFYNTDISQISSTKDFILMAAMDTMALTDQLPGGNTHYGPAEGKMFTYLYEADRDLTALNELAADPKLYASSTRDSLTTYRHISIRLPADATYDYSTMRDQLKIALISPDFSAQ